MHKQKTDSWLEFRRGKWNASETHALMNAKDDFTQAGLTYIYTVASERMGSNRNEISSDAIRWGNKYEPFARDEYSLRTGYEVKEVGSVAHPDHPMVACSSDGIIVGEKGGWECKCPMNPANHVKYMHDVKNITSKHMTQLQQNMWINDLEWMDFSSFDPRIETSSFNLYTVRFHRDDKYIKRLEERINKAEEMVTEIVDSIIKRKGDF